MSQEFSRSKLKFAGLFLTTLGIAIMLWISWLIWSDVTTWNKDMDLILFGSRTGERISLGIGMTVINYVLIGTTLLLSGFFTFLTLAKKLARGLAVITILGVVLFVSPLRGNVFTLIGAFIFSSTLATFLLGTVEIEIVKEGSDSSEASEIVTVKEDSDSSEASLKENYAYNTIKNITKFLELHKDISTMIKESTKEEDIIELMDNPKILEYVKEAILPKIDEYERELMDMNNSVKTLKKISEVVYSIEPGEKPSKKLKEHFATEP